MNVSDIPGLGELGEIIERVEERDRTYLPPASGRCDRDGCSTRTAWDRPAIILDRPAGYEWVCSAACALDLLDALDDQEGDQEQETVDAVAIHDLDSVPIHDVLTSAGGEDPAQPLTYVTGIDDAREVVDEFGDTVCKEETDA